jgi:hypothetical protein
MESGDSADVRFDCLQIARFESPYSRNAVGLGSLLDVREPSQITFVRSDDQLAALFVVDVMCPAVLAQEPRTTPAKPRFERPWLVIKARVNDATVVAGLVAGYVVLLLEYDDVGLGVRVQDLSRRGEPDDAGPDDYNPHAQSAAAAVGTTTTMLVPCSTINPPDHLLAIGG